MRTRFGVLLALALTPASADAATRFVSPDGAASGSCGRAAPCSVAWGLNGEGSAAEDTVIVRPGVYADQPVALTKPLAVTAAEDAPAPIFRTTAPGSVAFTVGVGAAGSVIDHLVIRANGAGAGAVDVQDEASLAGLTVSSVDGACLRSTARGLRIDDSTFTQTGVASDACLQSSGNDTNWTGVRVSALNGVTAAAFAGDGTIVDAVFSGSTTGLEATGNPTVRRVTATGSARGITVAGTATVTDSVAIARAGGSAVFSAGGSHQLLNLTAWATGAGSYGIRATNGAILTVKNSIARGGAVDISADPASITITADCGAFTGCPAATANVDHSNYRTATAVTDNGGNRSASPRFVDATFEDFHLRRGSPAIDAGAFLFNSGSADRDGRYRWLGLGPDMGAYEVPPAPRPPAAGRDFTPPRITRVGVGASRFRASTGTSLSLTVYEPADLVVVISRPGRRGATIGTIVRAVPFGRNRIAIRGPLDGKPLRPGRYVLSVMARDTAQNLSRERRFAITVVR